MNAPPIYHQLEEIEQLPTLPLVLRQLHKIMRNPRSNMNQIAAVIAKDQALASSTIRLVNSAYYGLRNRVSSINQAIVILGLNTLHSLMLGLSVIKLFPVQQGHQNFNHEQFWKHSFGTALLARSIAKIQNYSEPEDCFVGGLLHDIGKLIAEQFFHDSYCAALQLMHERNLPLLTAEKLVLGATHDNCGLVVARRWQLPDVLAAIIGYHHFADSQEEQYIEYKLPVQIVACADMLAHRHGLGMLQIHSPSPIDTLKELGLSGSVAETMATQAVKEVDAVIQEWRK
jgi:putative nucleotidyltransferase with HDIG domain